MPVRPSSQQPPLAVHGLQTCGASALWWEDSAAGARLMCASAGPGAAGPVESIGAVGAWDGLTLLAFYPGPGGAAASLFGHPGGDYGYLREGPAGDAALVRRPSLVWLRGVPGGRPGFVYTRFPAGAELSHPPVDGLHVAVHRAGTPFAADEVLLADLPAGSLVALEATAEPGVVLLRVADGGNVEFRLLHVGPGSGGGARSVPLRVNAGARTKLALGAGRWWRGEALGTSRATILATPPGTFDEDRAVRVALPEGTALVYFWATRRRIVLRCMSRSAEFLVAVDNDTLEQRVMTPEFASSRFPEIVATPADDCAAWLRVDESGGEATAHVEILDEGESRPRSARRFAWPSRTRSATLTYHAHDGAELPIQLQPPGAPGEASTVVLLEHGGITALANAPMERALAEMAASGEIAVARAVTRTLGPAYRTPDGARAYNDLLAAAQWLRRNGAGAGRIIVLGHSMGAVGAARAALLQPELFDATVLRFPVTDLVGFPCLGIGRHWIPMLGDPGLPEHRSALEKLSPLHMPLPEAPLPEVFIQVGWYDTRADRRHGRRLAERLRERGPARLSEYSVGHVERFADAESRRAVTDVTEFLGSRITRQPVARKEGRT